MFYGSFSIIMFGSRVDSKRGNFIISIKKTESGRVEKLTVGS
jgi:hypothetical protein